MVTNVRWIPFEEFAERLEAVFDEVDREQRPLLIQRRGRLYRIEPAAPEVGDDPWVKYDPKKAWAAMQAAIGALDGVDTAQLKADIKAARGQDSIGRPGN